MSEGKTHAQEVLTFLGEASKVQEHLSRGPLLLPRTCLVAELDVVGIAHERHLRAFLSTVRSQLQRTTYDVDKLG